MEEDIVQRLLTIGTSVLIFVMLPILGYLGLIREPRRRRELLGRLGDRFRGSVSGWLSPAFQGTYKGSAFELRTTVGTKYTQGKFHVRLGAPLPFALRVSRRRLGRGAGLFGGETILTGDPSFDKYFITTTSDMDKAHDFLRDRESVRGIQELFGMGFESFAIYQGGGAFEAGLAVDKNFTYEDLELDRVTMVLNALLALSKRGD